MDAWRGVDALLVVSEEDATVVAVVKARLGAGSRLLLRLGVVVAKGVVLIFFLLLLLEGEEYNTGVFAPAVVAASGAVVVDFALLELVGVAASDPCDGCCCARCFLGGESLGLHDIWSSFKLPSPPPFFV